MSQIEVVEFQPSTAGTACSVCGNPLAAGSWCLRLVRPAQWRWAFAPDGALFCSYECVSRFAHHARQPDEGEFSTPAGAWERLFREMYAIAHDLDPDGDRGRNRNALRLRPNVVAPTP